MSNFFEYLFLVVKRTFWGADTISKTFGVASLFAVVGFQFTSLSWETRLGLLATLVFFGTFKVWHDERKAKGIAQEQLKLVRDKTPTFQVTVGGVKRYTIKPILEKYTNETQSVQQLIGAKKVEVAKETRGSSTQTAFRVAGLDLAKLSSQLSTALNSSLIPRPETVEEKFERLSRHLSELQAYEEKLERLYEIDLNLIASRSDTNIEIWIKEDDAIRMIVSDNFARNHIPALPRSDSYRRPSILLTGGSFEKLPSELYLASYGDADGAYSKIANLNAQRSLHVFDEDFYIATDKNMVNLKITVASQKRNERQELTVAVPLKNTPTEELQENM